MEFITSNIKPEHLEKLTQSFYGFLPKVIFGIVLLLVGFYVIRILMKALRFSLDRRDLDPALKGFVTTLSSILLKLLLLISVASTVGISTTSFITVLGAMGLAIGMALQGSLGNFAGSVLIMVFKPFKVGDYIKAQSVEGTVIDISIFTTSLNTFDNQRIIIPNGILAGGVIENVTAESWRRLDLKVGISYADEVSKARQALIKLPEGDERILFEEGKMPYVCLTGYGDSSLDIQLRMWLKPANYWDCYFEYMEKIKIALDQEKITIPFPQRDVHFFEERRLDH